MIDDWDMYIMAIIYILAGFNHFVFPDIYKRIIPPGLRFLDLINWTSGASEIALGVLLLTPFQQYAAWGIIALLVLVFPANIYHLMQKGAGLKVPVWVLWLRLPLQFVLIWWAYQYT